MNTYAQIAENKKKHQAPLFASPWMALFLVLRKEFTQQRPGK